MFLGSQPGSCLSLIIGEDSENVVQDQELCVEADIFANSDIESSGENQDSPREANVFSEPLYIPGALWNPLTYYIKPQLLT